MKGHNIFLRGKYGKLTLLPLLIGSTACEGAVIYALCISFSLESEIEENKDRVPLRPDDTEQFLEDWLLELRKTDFINMHGVTERRYCNVQ